MAAAVRRGLNIYNRSVLCSIRQRSVLSTWCIVTSTQPMEFWAKNMTFLSVVATFRKQSSWLFHSVQPSSLGHKPCHSCNHGNMNSADFGNFSKIAQNCILIIDNRYLIPTETAWNLKWDTRQQINIVCIMYNEDKLIQLHKKQLDNSDSLTSQSYIS